ncbi:helix-turn-helix domain-containing protein [Halomonas caseinilytica]|uniref:helix-turn-helix domain-containing protein n=1 Tax=Halomonas caseinilytica TaxID=438744 RepID=UPI000941DEBE
MEKVLLTYHEAAEVLGVTHWTVRAWVRQGRLVARGSGKGRRVTVGSIRRMGGLDAEAPEDDAHMAPGVQRKETACHTREKARLTGGHRSLSAASELDDLLERPT